MLSIGLISDTHGYIGVDVMKQLEDCDEVWHAGDIGNQKTADILQARFNLKMVSGNIDGGRLRQDYPTDLFFSVEGLKVFMTHIGGYPGRYTKAAYAMIMKEQPDLFISGHSHILKVMPDKKRELLHMNPGSVGRIGLHKFRTMLKFEVEGGKVQNLKAIELGLRSQY